MHNVRLRVKPVVQQERTGCGIAAVAALSGVSYARAKRVAASLGIHAADRKLWSDTGYVRRLLARFGTHASPGCRPFASWAGLPDRALLAIKWHIHNDHPVWHWAVFIRDHGCMCVLDSKKTLKVHTRTDFGRIRPKWYIPIFEKRQGSPENV